MMNETDNIEFIRLNPDENWRKMQQIKEGTLREENLTLEECIERYQLTEEQVLLLKAKMKK